MDGLEQEAVDVSGVPVHYALGQIRVGSKHFPERVDGKFQNLGFAQGRRGQRKLYFEERRMEAGEDGAGTVEADEPAPAALVFGKTDRGAADVVLDAIIRLTGFPEIFPFFEISSCVRMSAEIFVKRGIVSGEVESRR